MADHLPLVVEPSSRCISRCRSWCRTHWPKSRPPTRRPLSPGLCCRRFDRNERRSACIVGNRVRRVDELGRAGRVRGYIATESRYSVLRFRKTNILIESTSSRPRTNDKYPKLNRFGPAQISHVNRPLLLQEDFYYCFWRLEPPMNGDAAEHGSGSEASRLLASGGAA